MANETLINETPYCDNGCGDHVTVRLEEVGLCDDCAQKAARESLASFRPICGRILYDPLRQQSICLMPYGVEHDHDTWLVHSIRCTSCGKRGKHADECPLNSLWEEYDHAAMDLARKGLKGYPGDPLPFNMTPAAVALIDADVEAFQDRVRNSAYALSMKNVVQDDDRLPCLSEACDRVACNECTDVDGNCCDCPCHHR